MSEIFATTRRAAHLAPRRISLANLIQIAALLAALAFFALALR